MKKRKLLSLLLAGGLLCGIVCSCGPTSEEASSAADSGTSSAESLSASSVQSSTVSSESGSRPEDPEFVLDSGNLKGYNGAGGAVILPDEVTQIEDGQFITQQKITSLTLSKNFIAAKETSYPSGKYPEPNLAYLNDQEFLRMEEKAFSEIKVAEGNVSFCVVDGVLYTKDMKTLLLYPQGKPETAFVIPDGVKVVAAGAFYRAKNLQEITIPASTEYLGRYAFGCCENLKTVNFSENKEINLSGTAFCDTKFEPKNSWSGGYNEFDAPNQFQNKIYKNEDLPNVTLDELEWLMRAYNARIGYGYMAKLGEEIKVNELPYYRVTNANRLSDLDALQRRYFFEGVFKPISEFADLFLEKDGKLYRQEVVTGGIFWMQPLGAMEMTDSETLRVHAPYLGVRHEEPHQKEFYIYVGVEDGRLKIKKIEAFYNGEPVTVGWG
ncbi:MAG: leucine-rich repeat protein [Oscillospiraceae bacterium]|nr:leucine-rich repeat protein [Oscillospiraceae bacterium]